MERKKESEGRRGARWLAEKVHGRGITCAAKQSKKMAR